MVRKIRAITPTATADPAASIAYKSTGTHL
jgi:hypothetical protein